MAFIGTTSIPLQFSGGINSKIDEFSLDQPYLQDAKNAVYNSFGRIDKRTGFTAISNNIQGGGNITSGAALTTFNSELILMDGTNLFSYQEEEQVWINRGTVFSTINQQTRVLNTKISTQSNPDVSSANNLSLYIWEDNRTFPPQNNGVRYSILNNDTNTIVLSDQLLYANGVRPKVIHDNLNFYCFYEASISSILMATIPIAAPWTIKSNFVEVATDGYSRLNFTPMIAYDALVLAGTNLPLVCYASQTGLRFNIPSSGALDPNTNINTIAMIQDSQGKIWITYSDDTNTYISCFTVSWNPPFFSIINLLQPTVINAYDPSASVNLAIIEGLDQETVNITSELQTFDGAGLVIPNNNLINNYVVSLDGRNTFIGQMRGIGLASKPFKSNRNLFINTIYASALQATYFTICLTQGSELPISSIPQQTQSLSFSIISKHAPQNGGSYRTNSLLSQCETLAEGSFLFAGQRKGAFTSFQNAQTVNLGCAGYTTQFEGINAFNNVTSNNNLHIVGGIKKIYDGISCVEDNFNVFPENSGGYGCFIDNATDDTVDGYFILNNEQGGNLTYNPLFGINQYQWIVTYEWTDNFGQVQRSGPSVAITAVTSLANQGALLTGPMLRLTEKTFPRSGVIISIYRTQVNGTIFYKITDDNDPLINDVLSDFWTFADVSSDTDIAANENLYTGSQLANSAPPPCSLISLMQNRLMINNTEDGDVLSFSQNKFEQDQYNTLAMDWNTSFVEGIDSRLGNTITAIGLLDASLAIFKENSIFILSGDGPNAFDTAGQFNDAQLLVSDTGCLNQNSLCFITQTPNSPGGLLFKSPKGIYLLGRDTNIKYIGAPVSRYNKLTITSAELLAQSNQVVFSTLEGTALIYNYFFDAWTTWEGLPAIDGAVWQDQLCLLKDNGTVLIQDITNSVFVDTDEFGKKHPIPMIITTPWIKTAGLQGYQSIFNCLLLASLKGPHILSVSSSFDYNPSIAASVLINSNLITNRWGGNPIWGSLGSWGNEGLFANYQFQINLAQNRCESLQLTFSDIDDPAANSQGYSLSGLVLECITHEAPFRVPAGNKVGMK